MSNHAEYVWINQSMEKICVFPCCACTKCKWLNAVLIKTVLRKFVPWFWSKTVSRTFWSRADIQTVGMIYGGGACLKIYMHVGCFGLGIYFMGLGSGFRDIMCMFWFHHEWYITKLDIMLRSILNIYMLDIKFSCFSVKTNNRRIE